MGASFQDLLAWQRAIGLALAVYRLTMSFPETEKFGLTNQMRRAAVSVSSNMAEGAGRATTGEFLQFLGIARGSNFEVKSQLVIARGLGFGRDKEMEEAERLSDETGRLLSLLIKSLQKEAQTRAQARSEPNNLAT